MATTVLAPTEAKVSTKLPRWSCAKCGASGEVRHTSPVHIALLALEAHRKLAPDCEGELSTAIPAATDAGDALRQFPVMPAAKPSIFRRIVNALCWR
jgi:hypothetical protein